MDPRFVGAESLGYRRQALRFEPGMRLVLDEAYRANQLPLLKPDHPKAIAHLDGSDAVLGRYGRSRVSAVVPIDADDLEASPAYRSLVAGLRRSSVAPKVDWQMAAARRDVLHATLYSRFELTMDLAEARHRLTSLAGSGRIEAAVGGFWMGSAFNRGRIYLPLYPGWRDGHDAFALLQRRLGGRVTGIYAVGLFNLVDDLDEAETAALARLVEGAAERVVAEITIGEITLLETNDDLALSGRTIDAVRL